MGDRGQQDHLGYQSPQGPLHSHGSSPGPWDCGRWPVRGCEHAGTPAAHVHALASATRPLSPHHCGSLPCFWYLRSCQGGAGWVQGLGGSRAAAIGGCHHKTPVEAGSPEAEGSTAWRRTCGRCENALGRPAEHLLWRCLLLERSRKVVEFSNAFRIPGLHLHVLIILEPGTECLGLRCRWPERKRQANAKQLTLSAKTKCANLGIMGGGAVGGDGDALRHDGRRSAKVSSERQDASIHAPMRTMSRAPFSLCRGVTTAASCTQTT